MDEAGTETRFQRDHARLHDYIEAVRQAEGEAVRAAMADLAYHLAGHFGAEEAETGWMAEAADKAPHRAELIDELQAEHGAMLAAANGVAQGHGDAESIDRLLATIEEHERREASVIADVWYEEQGVGD